MLRFYFQIQFYQKQQFTIFCKFILDKFLHSRGIQFSFKIENIKDLIGSQQMEQKSCRLWSARLKHSSIMLNYRSAYLSRRRNYTFLIALGNWPMVSSKTPFTWSFQITKTGDFSPFFGMMLESQAIESNFQFKSMTGGEYLVSSSGSSLINCNSSTNGWKIKKGDRLEVTYYCDEIEFRVNGVSILKADVKEPLESDCYRACAIICRQSTNNELITVVDIDN